MGEAYNAGESIASLMKNYGISQGTIIDHLARYLMAGNALRRGSDLSKLVTLPQAEQELAYAAFAELGTALLKPVSERLEGQVDYETLKSLRLLYLVDHS